jgi:hypothetical protein
MKGKILLFATVIAAMAMLFVSCRTLPVGEAEVSATVEIEVEIVHDQSEPAETQPSVQPAPDPVPAPQPEPAPAPEPVPEETPGEQVPGDVPGSEPSPTPAPAPSPAPSIQHKDGDIGPNGGIIFMYEGKPIETGSPVYAAGSYTEAVSYCIVLSSNMKSVFRLPSVKELAAIYNQLFLTGLLSVEPTYYWSGETDGDSAKVLNFDTGFEGSFYTFLDFISFIPVAELF